MPGVDYPLATLREHRKFELHFPSVRQVDILSNRDP